MNPTFYRYWSIFFFANALILWYYNQIEMFIAISFIGFWNMAKFHQLRKKE